MSRAFLRDLTENVFAAAVDLPIVPFVAFAPAGMEAAFDGVLAPGTQLILADGTPPMPAGVEGFGRCLLQAVQSLLAEGYASVCVLNSDSPTLPTAILRDAAACLSAPGDRIVMAPADDGGYTLLGMKQAHAHLFRDIAWSTDRVAGQTRDRAREAGLDLVELPSWYDVDDANSLLRLEASLLTRGEAYPAPHTAAYLRALSRAADRHVTQRAAS